MRFAFDAAAKPIKTVEVAALFGEGTHAAGGCASDAAAESVCAVEVAAVDCRGAGRALSRADLFGFAEAILAEKVAATGFTCRTRLAQFATYSRRVCGSIQVVVSGA